jgi:uncharacterized protein (TIGR03437 family)
VIRYTTNGKDPTEDDPVIPSGASVPITSSVTLKAKAWKSGWIESAVAAATFTVTATPPVVSEAGVVNAASFRNSGGFAPGSLVTIFGSGFTTDELWATSAPVPRELGGVQVLVGGSPAPLLYVGPRQINLQLPPELSGSGAVLVVRANGVAAREVTIPLSPVDPAIFMVGETGYGTIVKANTDILAMPVTSGIKSSPVRRGDIISIYCTGLGLTQTLVPAGVPAQSAIPTLFTPAVRVGNSLARILYSGTAPGFVGLYQVNVEIPPDAPVGTRVPLLIEIGGRAGPIVNIAIE